MKLDLRDLLVEVANLKNIGNYNLAEELLLRSINSGQLTRVQMAVLESALKSVCLRAKVANNVKTESGLTQLDNTNHEDSGITQPVKSLIVNFLDIDFDRTLGVLRIGYELLNVLDRSKLEKICVLCPSDRRYQFEDSAYSKVIVTDAPPLLYDGELLLHQFQDKKSNSRYKYTLIHDFHPFDIPWKYSNPHSMQSKILNNIYTSDIVFSHFPLTHQRIKELSPRKAARLHLKTTCRKTNNQTISQELKDQFESNQTNIFCPAQFQVHKDHITVIRAFHALNSSTTKLYFTGSMFSGAESYYECVLNAIEELDLASRICILGHVSEAELDYLYSNSDIVIQSGTAEGGALIAQEALSYGKVPVVCGIPPAKAHLKEIDKEGISYFYEPGNFLDLKSKMQQALLRNPRPAISCHNQVLTSPTQFSEIFRL